MSSSLGKWVPARCVPPANPAMGPVRVGVGRTLVVGGERPMSMTWRRVVTAKTLAVSALALVVLVIAVAHRRHLDATHGRNRERGHPAAPFSW